MIDRPKNVKNKTACSFGFIVTPVRPIDRDAPVELVSGDGPLTLLEKTEPSERKQAEYNLRMAAGSGMTGVGDYLRRGTQLFGVPLPEGVKMRVIDAD